MTAKETAEKEQKTGTGWGRGQHTASRRSSRGPAPWAEPCPPDRQWSRGTPLKRPQWKLGGDGDREEGAPAEAGGLGDPPGCKCPGTPRGGLDDAVRVGV